MFQWTLVTFIFCLSLSETVDGDLCWSFTTCADTDPTTSISANEHTSVGDILWQANATQPDGSDSNSTYTLTQYEKPVVGWTSLVLSSEGALSVSDSIALDYETLTNGSSDTPPHAILLITAVDPSNNRTNASVEITLVDVAETPSFTSLPATVSLNETQALTEEIFQVNFTDPDIYLGEIYSFSLATDPASAPFSINQTSGSVSVDADPCFDSATTPSYSLFVVLSDGTFTIVETLLVTIIDEPNYTPTLDNLPDIVNVNESELSGTSIFTVQASDENPCDVITFDLLTSGVPFALDSSNGQLTTNGSLDYEAMASYTLTINASDGSLATVTQTLVVDITDVDETPILTVEPSSVSVNESETGSQMLFSVDYSDPENLTLTPVLSVVPGGPVSLNLINSTAAEIFLDSSPSLDFENISSYVITVSVTDGSYNVSTTVTLLVLDVEEAPVFTNLPDSIIVTEETTVAGELFSVFFTDEDVGDVVTASLIDASPTTALFSCSAAGNISVAANTVFDYETAPEYNLTIQITDSTSQSVNSTLTVTITDVDEAPVIDNLPAEVNVTENSSGSVDILIVSSNDPEGNPLTYTITSIDPAGGPFNISATGTISIDSNPNFNYDVQASYNLTVEVDDGTLNTSSYVIVTINNEDRAPQIIPNNLSIPIFENETATRIIETIAFTDEDINDSWTFNLVSTDPSIAAFVCNQSSGNISFIDNPGFDFETADQYVLNISVTDSTGLTDYGLVTVDIQDVNEAPELSNVTSNLSLAEDDIGGRTLETAMCQDEEGDQLTFSMTSDPVGPFDIDSNLGDIRITSNPGLDFEVILQYNLTITCTDNNTLSDSSVLTIDITDVPETPVILNLPNTISILENSTGGNILIEINATDEDIGDVLSYNITDATPYTESMLLFSIDSTTGEVALLSNPNLDYEQQQDYNLTIEVTDATGLTAASNLTILVLDVNEEPDIVDLPNTTSVYDGSPGGDIVYQVTSTDPENDVLIYSIDDSYPSGAPFSVNDTGHVSLDSNPGLDHFSIPEYILSVTAFDGFLSDTKNLTVTILNTLDPPEFVNLTTDISVGELTLGWTHSFQFTDPDFENVTANMSVLGQIVNSPFQLSTTGELSVVSPGLDFESTPFYTLNVTLTDETGLTTSAEINVTILDENEAPLFTVYSITISLAEEQGIGTTISTGLNSTDVDSVDIAVYNLTGEGALYFDLVSYNSTELMVISRIDRDTPNSVTQISLGITVTDKGGLQDNMTITFDITDINDNFPVFDSTTLNASLAEDVAIGKLVSQVVTTDIDEGVNQNVFFSEVSANDYLQIDSSGRVEVKAELDYEKDSIVQYLIRARDGGVPQRSTTATLTLHVTDVYEPGPDWDKTFYSWEIYFDVAVGVDVGNIQATPHHAGTDVTYSFEATQGQFSINSTQGELAVQSGLVNNTKYVLYPAATDSQWIPLTESTIIRIDTYDQQNNLIDFIIERAESVFTEDYVETFKELLKEVIPGCQPKLIKVNKQPWRDYTYFNFSTSTASATRRRLLQTDSTTLTMVFLKNNNSDSIENLNNAKEFYTTPSLMQLFTSDDDSTPNEYFNSVTFSDYPITTIVPHIETVEVSENWWLDTTAGLATTIILCILGALLIILLILLICWLCKRQKKKKQQVFEPLKAENSAVVKDDMKLMNVPTIYTSPPTYSQVGMTSKQSQSWQAPWESYNKEEVICKPPPLVDGKRRKSNANKQTTFHSHSSEIFDDQSENGSSRSVTPVSDLRSVSQNDVLSVREIRASLVTPVGK